MGPHTAFIGYLVRTFGVKVYLELGTNIGYTFNEVKKFVPMCLGVEVDPRKMSGPNIFNCTTDDFFRDYGVIPPLPAPDLIFIDADHTYEQVRKDLENSLKSQIEELLEISFYIEDMVDNSNTYTYSDFSIDNEKPYSSISNVDDIDSEINKSSVIIIATADDNKSDIQNVGLYYRIIGDDDWILFATTSNSPYNWSFTASSNQYELCTVATDLAGNVEDYKDIGEVSFTYDPNPPTNPKSNN